MQIGEEFWSDKYKNQQTGWDAGSITPPIKTYIDQLIDKKIKILIPGCGNAYEAEYLFIKGFSNTYIADISKEPLVAFKNRVNAFPVNQLLHTDFFKLDDSFDLIIEQTFLSALDPAIRNDYARQCHNLLELGGRLVGVLFDAPMFDDHPPFGGSAEIYRQVYEPYFDFKIFERCYNSLPGRKELFINLIKKRN